MHEQLSDNTDISPAAAVEDAQDPMTPEASALAAALLEVMRHVGDAPLQHPRLFCLARSADLLAQQPALASLLGDEAALVMAGDPLHLTSIELDDLDTAEDSETAHATPSGTVDPVALLEAVMWPQPSHGGAIVCDLPAGAWQTSGPAHHALDAKDDEQSAPGASTLRVGVAVTTEGTRWSAVQTEGAGGMTMGEALLPALADALTHSLEESARS